MLGSLVGRKRWQWTLWGKHPAVGDFISHGLAAPVEQAIAAWIENGYARLTDEKILALQPRAWRFWTQSAGNHQIACGIISNSGDRLGRPFPLLIMGTGKLTEWERHWEYLPIGLEHMWRRMEALTASRADRYTALKQALDKIQPPDLNWSELLKKYDPTALPETDRLFLNEIGQTGDSTANGHQVVALGEDSVADAVRWHQKIKTRNSNIPTALFMGGALESPHMVVFRRALSPADFHYLWTIGSLA